LTSVEKLEQARVVCAEIGLPIDMLNTLAVDIPTAGQLLGGISPSSVKRQISTGDLEAFKVGRNTLIELVELVDFIDRNRISTKSKKTTSTRAQAMALLDESDE
jgi:hypothetical protein